MKRFILFVVLVIIVDLVVLLSVCRQHKPQSPPVSKADTLVFVNPSPERAETSASSTTISKSVPPAPSVEGKSPFRWVDDENYPPLIYRGPDGKPAGIFYEIVDEAFQRMGIPHKVRLYPWPRAQKIVIEGGADGLVTALTKKRKRYFVASDPILLASEEIFANRNNPRIDEIMAIRSLKQLRSFRVVETIGSGWTEENLQGAKIIWVPDMDNAFFMLIKGRADVYIANGFTGAYFIRKKIRIGDSLSEGYRQIIVNPYPLSTIAFRLLIRKGSPYVKIIDDFNKTIHQMQLDGTIQHIIENAGLPSQGVYNKK